MKVEIFQKLSALANEDPQGRKGNYPRSGVPDDIAVFGDITKLEIEFTFKNTSESEAKAWVERKIRQVVAPGKSSTPLKIELDSAQTGDYQDDWVTVYAKIS